MIKPKFIHNPIITIIEISFPFIMSIFFLFFKEYGGFVFSIFVMLVFLLPSIIWRKKIFAKMLINNEGIFIYYNKKVINKLKWENIKVAIICRKNPGLFEIDFLTHELFEGKEIWKNNDAVFINFKSDFIDYVYQYSDHIKVPIKNIDMLPKVLQDKFKLI